MRSGRRGARCPSRPATRTTKLSEAAVEAADGEEEAAACPPTIPLSRRPRMRCPSTRRDRALRSSDQSKYLSSGRRRRKGRRGKCEVERRRGRAVGEEAADAAAVVEEEEAVVVEEEEVVAAEGAVAVEEAVAVEGAVAVGEAVAVEGAVVVEEENSALNLFFIAYYIFLFISDKT